MLDRDGPQPLTLDPRARTSTRTLAVGVSFKLPSLVAKVLRQDGTLEYKQGETVSRPVLNASARQRMGGTRSYGPSNGSALGSSALHPGLA
jgi:hypothetical protein